MFWIRRCTVNWFFLACISWSCMTVKISSSSTGKEQCFVSEIYKNDFQCVENETALPLGWHLRQSLKSLCILSKEQRKHLWIMKAAFSHMRHITKQEENNEYIWWWGCFIGMLCLPMKTMQGATFVSWPLPSNTILVSKSLRVQETTRLCWGLYDSNYIICPICYCFIHVRIICFGFLCNVLGFVYPPSRDLLYSVCPR